MSRLLSNTFLRSQSFQQLGSRKLSTGSWGGSEKKHEPKLSKKEKFKSFLKQYGVVVIIVHLTNSLIVFGIVYAAISCGVNMTWILTLMDFSENIETLEKGGTVVLAYTIYKVLAPLRLSITFAATPYVAKHLYRIFPFLKRKT